LSGFIVSPYNTFSSLFERRPLIAFTDKFSVTLSPFKLQYTQILYKFNAVFVYRVSVRNLPHNLKQLLCLRECAAILVAIA
jgi:hypothetical protein